MGNRISSAVSVKRRDNGSVIDKLTEAQLDEFREAFNSFDKVCAGCGLLVVDMLSTSHWEERTRCPRAREGTRRASRKRASALWSSFFWPPRSHAARACSEWRWIHRCQRAEGADGVSWAEPDR